MKNPWARDQSVLAILACILTLGSANWAQPQEKIDDPLADLFQPALRPSLEVFLEACKEGRRYQNADFPMLPETFAKFRTDLVHEVTRALGLEDWTVRAPSGKTTPLTKNFQINRLAMRVIHGVTTEIITVKTEPYGLAIPMIICLPETSDPRPAVCCFSGHSSHGLHDLVINLDSYQEGAAIRLAQAGFVSIAVEKIDTGYLSRDGLSGVDEQELATLLLSSKPLLRAEQLKACLAAVEIAAGHSRVDETRIGVTGASLGGWLSVQTALLSDRIAAVADFGRKTRSLDPSIHPKLYKGQADLCHIIPGLLGVCDRNLHPVALAPLPMLAGHGKKDTGSHRESPEHFRAIGEAQYEALGAAHHYEYLVHEGGDTLPSKELVKWFNKVFE